MSGDPAPFGPEVVTRAARATPRNDAAVGSFATATSLSTGESCANRGSSTHDVARAGVDAKTMATNTIATSRRALNNRLLDEPETARPAGRVPIHLDAFDVVGEHERLRRLHHHGDLVGELL